MDALCHCLLTFSFFPLQWLAKNFLQNPFFDSRFHQFISVIIEKSTKIQNQCLFSLLLTHSSISLFILWKEFKIFSLFFFHLNNLLLLCFKMNKFGFAWDVLDDTFANKKNYNNELSLAEGKALIYFANF